jgi:hypothetical protein
MTPIRPCALSIDPELFHAPLVGLRWDHSRQKIERTSVDASDKYREIPDKKDEPNTLEAEVTFLPTIPTQSRLSANDTTPHLRKWVVNNTSSLCFWEKNHLLINPYEGLSPTPPQ